MFQTDGGVQISVHCLAARVWPHVSGRTCLAARLTYEHSIRQCQAPQTVVDLDCHEKDTQHPKARRYP
jgi:hypothetical protein